MVRSVKQIKKSKILSVPVRYSAVQDGQKMTLGHIASGPIKFKSKFEITISIQFL